MSPVPILGQPQPAKKENPWPPTPDNGPWVRILKCYSCRSIEVIAPVFPYGNPTDEVLDYVTAPHQRKNCDKGLVGWVLESEWDDRNKRKAIVDKAFEGEAGFKPSYYDVRDTLQEDAVKCFAAHNRPNACIDWRDSTKLLSSPAAKERRWLARETKSDTVSKSAPRRWLCDYCPVMNKVLEKQREVFGVDNVGNIPR